MNDKPQRWSYGIRREKSGYGPYVCDIYFGLNQIDYHTCCKNKQEAIDLGKYWVNWLKKCDKTFSYDPTKWKKWLDWYTIAYSKTLFPSKT